MKKRSIVFVALLLAGCGMISIQNNQPKRPLFSDFVSSFLQNQNPTINPSLGLYTKYNPGVMPRITHFDSLQQAIQAHQETRIGQWGSGEKITCDTFDAVLENPIQKCSCDQDIQPISHKCKIWYVSTGMTTTFISDALRDDLSEAGTEALTSWDMLQIEQAKEAESKIGYRLYMQDQSAVWYFAPSTTWYDLLFMDITDCCSA